MFIYRALVSASIVLCLFQSGCTSYTITPVTSEGYSVVGDDSVQTYRYLDRELNLPNVRLYELAQDVPTSAQKIGILVFNDNNCGDVPDLLKQACANSHANALLTLNGIARVSSSGKHRRYYNTQRYLLLRIK